MISTFPEHFQQGGRVHVYAYCKTLNGTQHAEEHIPQSLIRVDKWDETHRKWRDTSRPAGGGEDGGGGQWG